MDLQTNFEELMQRSPIPPHDMKTFLREMRRTPSGTVSVSKLLASKIQSSSEAQAIHAFEFLEAALESESEGSIEFRTEIGRYRFLNEIIRILSPKYLGDSTAEPVKERAVKFLEDASGAKRKRWFPSEHSKVNSVYQSLVDGGIIQKPHRVADEDAEFQKSIFERGENAVILKRLLQSKDPSDLQAANRLIKTLVDEEARRNERRAELHSLIDRIETSTCLLSEMLNQTNIDREIVEELVDTCRSLRQKLGGIATETNDEVTSLLQASENIENVLQLYENIKTETNQFNTPKTDANNATNSGSSTGNKDSLTDSLKTLSLADELLMNWGDDKMKSVIQQPTSPKCVKRDDAAGGDNLLLNLDVDLTPIVPVSKFYSETEQTKTAKPESTELFGEISKLSREMMEEGLRGVPNLKQLKKTDKTPLSQMRVSSQERSPVKAQAQFPGKISPLAPPVPVLLPGNSKDDPMSLLDLNFLETSSSSTETKASSSCLTEPGSTSSSSLDSSNHQQTFSSNHTNILLDLESDKPALLKSNRHNNNNSNGVKASANSNDVPLSSKENQLEGQNTSTESNNSMEVISNGRENKTVRSLVDSGFCLNSIRELDLENIDLLEDLKPIELNVEESCKDVSLTLTFGKYPGFPCSVCVAVITLTNRNKNSGILNYVFQLLPPKGLQVKLLPPETMELPPWKKTFLPPPILTQVALIVISKPNSTTITPDAQLKVKYILSCCVEDETILHNGEFFLPKYILQ